MQEGSGEEVYVIAQGNTPTETAATNPFSTVATNPFSNIKIEEPQIERPAEEIPQHEGQTVNIIDDGELENSENVQPYELAEVSSEEEVEGDNYMRNVVRALVILFVASVVVLAQASQDCENANACESWRAYAVALGLVSTLISLFMVLTIFCHESEKNTARIIKLMPYFSVFFTLWWGVGVASCTFDGPFEKTGNGFFATWISLFISIYICQITISKFATAIKSFWNDIGNPQQRVMGMIMVLSLAEVYSCLLQMNERTGSTGEKASPQEKWGLSCGLISAALVIVFLFLESRVRSLSGQPGLLAYFLIPWWLFGAGVLTFDEPFTATGNGYFCAWGCFCESCYLLYLAQTEKTKHIIRRLSMLGSEPGATKDINAVR